MEQGWIKLHRSIYNHWLWKEDTKLKWWLDLLLMANHTTRKILLGNQLFEIPRGSLHTSVTKLTARWQADKKTVKRFLDLLQKDSMISYTTTSKGTTINISNYNDFQDYRKAESPGDVPALSPEEGTTEAPSFPPEYSPTEGTGVSTKASSSSTLEEAQSLSTPTHLVSPHCVDTHKDTSMDTPEDNGMDTPEDISKGTTVDNPITISEDITVDNPITTPEDIPKDITVDKTITIPEDITVNNTITIPKGTTVDNTVTTPKGTTVNNTVTIPKSTTVDNTVTTPKGTTVVNPKVTTRDTNNNVNNNKNLNNANNGKEGEEGKKDPLCPETPDDPCRDEATELPPLSFPTPLHKKIHNTLGDIAYRTWFMDADITFTGGGATLKVDSPFKRDVINTKFRVQLGRILGKIVEVKSA